MHDSAMAYGKLFFDTYVRNRGAKEIIEIGSQDINGSLRSVAPDACNYIGVDFVEGKGVDVVMSDPYNLPFPENSFDVCVCSSCLEHSEFFWLLFNDMLRILRPDGVLYINVPSNGPFHRYPVDCWRFYPDSGAALQRWGRQSGYNVALMESFVGAQQESQWNDCVLVFIKSVECADAYAGRIQHHCRDVQNSYVLGAAHLENYREFPDDLVAHRRLKKIVDSMNAVLRS
jgi:SAM-dependent methyltransferase